MGLRSLRTLPERAGGWASIRVSRFGERFGIDPLTYNPLQMRNYHRLALMDAVGVMQGVAEVFPDARRYVDVGSGTGAFAAEAVRRGRAVRACERSLTGRFLARRHGVPCASFDLRRSPPAVLDGPFDLAYCFEVAEHLSPDLGDRLVEFVVGLAPVVVFTAARPGQGGLGHVNEQPASYWVERFARNRAAHKQEYTELLRSSFIRHGVQANWFTENAMVFETRRA